MTGELLMVSGAIGVDAYLLHPHSIAVETCSGYNLIARGCLPTGWERHVVDNATVPSLGGADGAPLKLMGTVELMVRFRNAAYRLPFVIGIADTLAVDVLVGMGFIRAHIKRIEVQGNRIEFMRGGSAPIIGKETSLDGRTSTVEEPARPPSAPKEGTRPDEFDTYPVRLARGIVIPPLAHRAAWSLSDAAGLVMFEPKHPPCRFDTACG